MATKRPTRLSVDSIRVVERLVAQGATLVIVACNTATVLAIETLRALSTSAPETMQLLLRACPGLEAVSVEFHAI